MPKAKLLKNFLLCSAYLLSAAASLQAAPIEAGPIWNNTHASKICSPLCAKHNLNWDGKWWTTVKGKMSLCNCLPPADNTLPKPPQEVEKNIVSSPSQPLAPELEQPQSHFGSGVPDNQLASADTLMSHSDSLNFQEHVEDGRIVNSATGPAAEEKSVAVLPHIEDSSMVIAEEQEEKEATPVVTSTPDNLIQRVENCLIAAKNPYDKYYWSGWMGPLNKQARIVVHSEKVKEYLKEECPAIKEASLEVIQQAMMNIENKVGKNRKRD